MKSKPSSANKAKVLQPSTLRLPEPYPPPLTKPQNLILDLNREPYALNTEVKTTHQVAAAASADLRKPTRTG